MEWHWSICSIATSFAGFNHLQCCRHPACSSHQGVSAENKWEWRSEPVFVQGDAFGCPHAPKQEDDVVFPLKLGVDYVPTECPGCYGRGHVVLMKTQTFYRPYWLMAGRTMGYSKQSTWWSIHPGFLGRGAFLLLYHELLNEAQGLSRAFLLREDS